MKKIVRKFIIVFLLLLFAHSGAYSNDWPSVPFIGANGKWGMIFDFSHIVLPQYDMTASLDYKNAFWAKKDGKWGLRNSLNQEILPFIYDDVSVNNSQSSNFVSILPRYLYDNTLVLNDTIFDWPVEYHQEPIRGSDSYGDNSFPLLTVCKDGDWGYIDYNGKPVTDFIYDLAFPYKDYYKNYSIPLAIAARGGKWVIVDIFGHEPSKKRFDNFPDKKKVTKNIKKLSNDDKSVLKNEENRLYDIMRAQTAPKPYENLYNDSINVINISVSSKKAPANKKTQKKQRSGKTEKVKPLYQIRTSGGELIVPDTFDVVYPRQGDFIRVMKNGKMGLIRLGEGFIEECVNDSIAPVDEYGMSMCISEPDITFICGPNRVYQNLIPELKEAVEINRKIEEEDQELARSNIGYLSQALQMIDIPEVSYILSDYIDRVIRVYDNCYDPVKIAEREERKRRMAQLDSSSGLGLLGELLTDVGSLVGGEKGNNMSTLGETISSVSGNANSDSQIETKSSSSVNYTGNTDAVNKRIAEIDNELSVIAEQQAALVSKHQSAKSDVRRAGQTAVKGQTGANAIRNFSPSRARKNAEIRSNAQRGANNELSSIGSMMKQLSNRREELIAERNQLCSMLVAGNESAGHSRNNVYDGVVAENKEKAKKSQAAVNHYRSARKTIDTCENTLYDLKRDSGGRSTSELRSEVRKLQKKIKDTLAEYKRLTGDDLSHDSTILNWNP